MRKKGTTTAIFGGIALMAALTGCGDAGTSGSARVDTPKTLVGTWYQTNTLDSGVVMVAEVHSGGAIQVSMKTRDSSSIYWMCSFESYKNPRSNFKITSQADPDAQKILAGSIFGSQDTSKRFAYKNGELSFDFTMTGTTSTIRLRKPYESQVTTKTSANPKVTKTPPAKVQPVVTKTPPKSTSTKK